MEIAGLRLDQEIPKYSENLFSKKTLFLNEPTANVTAGSGTISYVDNIVYNNTRSAYCFMQSYKSTDITFNFGTTFATTIKNTGNHLFSFRINNPNTALEFFVPFEMYVNVFVNGNPTYEIYLISVGNYTVNSKKWITWFQSLAFQIGDVVDFSFTVAADLSYPYNNMSFQMGGFKLEYDDRFLEFPSIYSEPKDILITTSETLDFPSIANNTMEFLTVSIPGAEIGDYIEIVAPNSVNALNIVLDCYVSNTNEITVKAHNSSGASINPTSGIYTFKIVK